MRGWLLRLRLGDWKDCVWCMVNGAKREGCNTAMYVCGKSDGTITRHKNDLRRDSCVQRV